MLQFCAWLSVILDVQSCSLSLLVFPDFYALHDYFRLSLAMFPFLLTQRSRISLLVIAAFVLLVIVLQLYSGASPSTILNHVKAHTKTTLESHNDPDAVPHPIDNLVRHAEKEWDRLKSTQVSTLADATKQYRQRRGRHPPPGFDQWFAYAHERDAVFIEELFDQIYDDLSPFWGLSPQKMRQQASGFDPRIIVRNHTLLSVGRTGVNWLEVWSDIISKFTDFLPDMDIPLNGMDEPRIIIPWETLSDYRKQDLTRRKLISAEDTTTEYMGLSDFDADNPPASWAPQFQGPGVPYWDIMRDACPPESPGRTSNIPRLDFANPPRDFFNYRNVSKTGYMEDFERSKDPCWRPELQAMHGTFIEPTSISTTHELFPMFGGSKLTVNNEILFPPPVYYHDNPNYSGGWENQGGPWIDKNNTVFWRGIASGGRNRAETWTGYQRHRLVSMLNGTSVSMANGSSSHGINFRQPDYQYYNVWAGLDGTLPEFLEDHCDVGFVDLCCFPGEGSTQCSYTDQYFSLVEGKGMKDMYAYKYLPDVDGNSFSGRYRAFLLSTSLPIKATVYKEWHDSRLIPWAHFVPMDSLYMDIYGILQYFMGYKGHNGHDRQAEKIAMNGKSWAEQVLRLEDMEIYVFRLLLEYARLSDDRRDTLAFVDKHQ